MLGSCSLRTRSSFSILDSGLDKGAMGQQEGWGHASSPCARLRLLPAVRPWGSWPRGQNGCRSAGSIHRYASSAHVPRRRHAPVHSRIFELARIFAKGLFALFADEGHVKGLHERVVGLLLVALCAVEPFFAWSLVVSKDTSSSSVIVVVAYLTYSRGSGWRPGR